MSRSTIAEAWLAKLGQPTAAADPFRDPVAHTFQQMFPALVECVLGRISPEAAAGSLERVMRIQAVQASTPAQAVAFLTELEQLVEGADAHARIDRLTRDAHDQYIRCREEIDAIRHRELRRRNFVAERMRA